EANKLMVSTVNPEYGESKEEMDIEFSGDPIKAAFNPKFLMDALSMIDDEKVIFDVIDGNHACLLKGAEDHTFTSFIMPMRF
ncbi:DNA polymerase III subunit beta, partial [Desulfosarcina sp. OttesenSCG-928-G17]|nr:DNA polymerase III subunit beta [Desulfosarcina sp. OttesenSCG-928-G17]